MNFNVSVAHRCFARVFKYRVPIWLFLLLWLNGCVNQPVSLTNNKTNSLQNKQHWLLKARVAIRTEEDNLSATLDWQKSADDFDFHLYGLMGATYAHLIQEDHNVTLKLPEDQIFHHNNAQQLMFEALGWDFPIDALAFWIKGLPSGKKQEIINRDKNNRLKSISFDDWTIEFSKYETYSGFLMPKMIKAKNPEMSLKIVVKKWNFSPSH